MQSRISTILAVAALFSAHPVAAGTLAEAIDGQEARFAQAKADAVRATSMALSMNAADSADKDTPVLFSVMSMGGRYVLRFNTAKGSYIVTNASSSIGDKWNMVKFDGLSAVIQKGRETPVRVYLSVPEDIDQAQAARGQTQTPASMFMPPVPQPQQFAPQFTPPQPQQFAPMAAPAAR